MAEVAEVAADAPHGFRSILVGFETQRPRVPAWRSDALAALWLPRYNGEVSHGALSILEQWRF